MRTPCRILVVEDDQLIRRLCVTVLARDGFQVDEADNGDTAWAALCARHFDLLVTDYRLPGLSGLELIKKMRAQRMTLPAILVSGALPMEELRANPWLGIAATLAKPFSMSMLLDTVKKTLREHSSRRALFQSCGHPPGRTGVKALVHEIKRYLPQKIA